MAEELGAFEAAHFQAQPRVRVSHAHNGHSQCSGNRMALHPVPALAQLVLCRLDLLVAGEYEEAVEEAVEKEVVPL